MRVTYHNTATPYPTNETALPKYFVSDGKKRNAYRLIAGEGYVQINERLDEMEKRIKKCFDQLKSELKRVPLHAELKQAFGGKPKTFFEYAEQLIEKLPERTNRKTGKKVHNKIGLRYKLTVDRLKEYCLIKNIDLDFENVSVPMYEGFVDYLTNKHKLSPSTIGRHIANWKSIMNSALAERLHSNMVHTTKQFHKFTDKDMDAVYCDVEDLEELFNVRMEGQMKKVQQAFIVGCWTGLRQGNYGDIDSRYVSGNRIKLLPVKEGLNELIIPLHKHVKSILKENNNQLPKVSLNEMNKWLPVVCALSERLKRLVPKRFIKGGILHESFVPKYEMIRSHTARRSFATNASLLGIPDHVTMKIGGWEDERSFQRYKIIEREKAAELMEEKFQEARV